MLLYTDGILEAANDREEEFGEERLCALLEATAGLSPAEATDRIIDAVQRWSPLQSDDLTVLVCVYRSRPNHERIFLQREGSPQKSRCRK